MVSGEIGARSWDKGREAGDEVCWAEQDVRGAVVEWVLELVDDLAGRIQKSRK